MFVCIRLPNTYEVQSYICWYEAEVEFVNPIKLQKLPNVPRLNVNPIKLTNIAVINSVMFVFLQHEPDLCPSTKTGNVRFNSRVSDRMLTVFNQLMYIFTTFTDFVRHLLPTCFPP